MVNLRLPSLSECLLKLFLLPLCLLNVLNISFKSSICLFLPSSTLCQTDDRPDVWCVNEDLVDLLD